METLINKKIRENSSEALAAGAVQTINEIEEFITFNEFTLSDKIKIESGMLTSKEKALKNKIDAMTLNQRKRFKRTMNRFLTKGTLKSANRFLHFLYKKVLLLDTRIKINYSEKQLKIIAAREKYTAARKIMLQAYSTYKEEKGNFYKSRLDKKQKIQ